jgi:ABC-type sugar transport system ATPase subunit
MRGVSKRYGGTLALRNVDFAASPGEIHALVGENGAGKSTLVKIATGAVRADDGEIVVDGAPRSIANPLDAQRLGIRVVHQHVSLVPQLSATENILLGQLPTGRVRWWVDWHEAHRRARQILDEIGFAGIPLREPVRQLSLAQRKLIDIAKALVDRPRLLIMDEPTAPLSHEERTRLFALTRRLRGEGTAIIYISHDLDEILDLADQITVLRDGAVVGTTQPATSGKQRLIEMMVGRNIGEIFPQRAHRPGPDVLRVTGLSGQSGFQDISLSVRRGEIVGVYGLVGSGRTEMARCIFGADRPVSGEIRMHGNVVRPSSPRQALDSRIAMLTEDRIRDGLVLFLPVRHNVVLANFPLISRWGVVSRRRERSVVETKVVELNVRPRETERRVGTLSGGNQQKVVLAKWLTARADLLILDEPTAGVDIAAKQEIYRIVSGLAESGMAILMISSELPEVLGLSDRVLVMRKGRLVGELPRGEASEQRLLAYAAGVAA